MAYDRYTKFRVDGAIDIVPFVNIREKQTDFHETYIRGKSRLDLISFNYYGDANYAWLIMQANPEYGSMEYEIPDGSVLRIPYPLQESISDYENAINNYKKFN